MKFIIYLSLSTLLVIFSACKGEAEGDGDGTDTTAVDTTFVDTSLVDTMMLDTGQYVDEEVETANLIEEKYGEQWDFCDCVVKNDSINKVVADAPDDADYDAIFARMDEIDMHCKEMLTTPNTTPEEREKHERRVRKCLKNAK